MTEEVSQKIQAHPDAAVFPMMPDDELRELAEDIKRNGQQMPILIKDDQIVDGRNRYEACLLAGVEPVFEQFSGEDVTAFIVSANVNRRHMTKGARAMAVAMLYPEGHQGRRDTSLKIKEVEGVNGGYLSQARTVLAHSKELASIVLSGAESLSAAYQKAKEAMKSAETIDSRFQLLKEKCPDIAEKVAEETLTLSEGEAVMRQREEEDRKRVAGLNDSLSKLSEAFRRISEDIGINRLAEFIRDERDKVSPDVDPKKLVDDLIKQLRKLRETAK